MRVTGNGRRKKVGQKGIKKSERKRRKKDSKRRGKRGERVPIKVIVRAAQRHLIERKVED